MGTSDNPLSINGKAITYREDLGKDNYYRYGFYTNEDSKRALRVESLSYPFWMYTYIHADD